MMQWLKNSEDRAIVQTNPFEPLGPEAETIARSTVKLSDGRFVGRMQDVKVEAEGIVSFGIVIWMIDGNVVEADAVTSALLSEDVAPFSARLKRSVRDWIWRLLS